MGIAIQASPIRGAKFFRSGFTSDLSLLDACARGALPSDAPQFSRQTALTVVLAARGYPGPSIRGTEIRGLERAGALPGVTIHHSATRRDNGRIFADGGRTLAITALGGSVSEAQQRAYAAVDMIDWPEGFCRRDIGWRAIARERIEAASATGSQGANPRSRRS